MSIVGVKKVVSHLLGKKGDSNEESLLSGNSSEGYGTRRNDNENNIQSSPSVASFKSDEREESSGNLFGSFDPRFVSDLIIGLSDGLTVPFALTAGLSSLGDTSLVITGGMAELVSGAISMGLGGFLAARSELDYYRTQVGKEKQEFFKRPDLITQEVEDILFDIGIQEDTAALFLRDLEKSPKDMIDFVIRFGKGLEEPAENRQVISALTIGSGYFFGGFIPLFPYFFTTYVYTGFIISVIVMVITLFWFGYLKTSVSLGDEASLGKKVSEGFQMVLIGSLAAGAAWGLVRLIE